MLPLYQAREEVTQQRKAATCRSAQLWNALSDAEKLLHFRTTELPERATVRGLQRLPGGWAFGYTRGQYTPDVNADVQLALHQDPCIDPSNITQNVLYCTSPYAVFAVVEQDMDIQGLLGLPNVMAT